MTFASERRTGSLATAASATPAQASIVRIGSLDSLFMMFLCSIRTPDSAPWIGRCKSALFWSAPAERSGDGALDRLLTAVETPSGRATRPHHPKRRGASLPAALQDA